MGQTACPAGQTVESQPRQSGPRVQTLHLYTHQDFTKPPLKSNVNFFPLPEAKALLVKSTHLKPRSNALLDISGQVQRSSSAWGECTG